MTLEITLLFVIVLASSYLIFECVTELTDKIKFFVYKGSATAKVIASESFSISRSRRLVEHKKGQQPYTPVRTTQDKNLNYFYMFSPTYWLYRTKKIFPTLEWNNGESEWRVHYPYARKWRVGDQITIHYDRKSHWKYAVNDKTLTWSILLKCSFCILCIFICSILLINQIR